MEKQKTPGLARLGLLLNLYIGLSFRVSAYPAHWLGEA